VWSFFGVVYNSMRYWKTNYNIKRKHGKGFRDSMNGRFNEFFFNKSEEDAH
jgi:hypothetical protein